MGTKVSIVFNENLGAGFFSGEGFILQRIEGDGRALSMQEELWLRKFSTEKLTC
jgi:uncharacterized protein (AIM24 family)